MVSQKLLPVVMVCLLIMWPVKSCFEGVEHFSSRYGDIWAIRVDDVVAAAAVVVLVFS